MTVMPDCLNKTEAEAQALLTAAGIVGSRIIRLWPAVSATAPWDDHDTVGDPPAGSGNSSVAYAPTVGADGTISYQQPAPGETFDGTAQIGFDLWGFTSPTPLDDDGVDLTLAEWTAAPFAADAPDLTTGPWTWADWEAGSSFRIELWTLHKPTTPATLIGEVTQFADVSVREEHCGQTELSFTISMHDSLAAGIGAYTQAAKVYYRNQIKPVFFAPVTFVENYGQAEGKLTVSGINAIRLQHHFLRRGDLAINLPDDEGKITLDGDGYAMLLDAAQNTDGQDAREVPVLGIELDDQGSAQADVVVGVERGDNVWDTMLEVANNALAHEFELDPQPDTDGVYMLLRIWNSRGSDRTATVRYFYGVTDTGDNPDELDNVASVTATPLQPITHAHALDVDKRYRITAADADSSAARGIFVEWVQSDLKIHKKPSTKKTDLDALGGLAQRTVDAYSDAPLSLDLELRPDAGQTSFYREHFWPGDTVWVAAAAGTRSFAGVYRIRTVEVGEQGSRGVSITKLEVVPDVTVTNAEEDA